MNKPSPIAGKSETYAEGYMDGYEDCLVQFQKSIDESGRRTFWWSVAFVLLMATVGILPHII